MSPTLLKTEGFKFFFYANEHVPKHIHVFKGDCFAKVNLETLTVQKNSFRKSDLGKVLGIIKKQQKQFLEAWDDYFKR
jgi:hypothetical protein